MRKPKPMWVPTGRRLLLLDALLVAWVCLWIALGVRVGSEVDGLTELSGTVRATGAAVEETGRALGSLGSLPLIGDRVDVPADRIQEAGRSARASGRSSRDSVEALSVLLAVAVAVIPSLPLAVLYLPLRVASRRESQALQRMAASAGDDDAFRHLLARRALLTLAYQSLERIAPEPWGELSQARRDELADEELRRLGAG